MTRRMSERIFSGRSIVGAAAPPRNANDDEDEGDEEDGRDEDDDREPAVIREPDEEWSHRNAPLLDPTRAHIGAGA